MNVIDNESENVEISHQMSVKEAGARGGRKTAERGSEYFRKIGRRGGKRTAELYRDMLSEWGKRGGRPKRPDINDLGDKDRS